MLPCMHVKRSNISPCFLCVFLSCCQSLKALTLGTASAGSTHYWAGGPCLTGWSAFCDGTWSAEVAPSLCSCIWGQTAIENDSTLIELCHLPTLFGKLLINVCLLPVSDVFTLQAGCWRSRSWPGEGASEEMERRKETTSPWSKNSLWRLLTKGTYSKRHYSV